MRGMVMSCYLDGVLQWQHKLSTNEALDLTTEILGGIRDGN